MRIFQRRKLSEKPPHPQQQMPESQITPFGPKQLAWIDKKYGRAFFRNPEPMYRGSSND